MYRDINLLIIIFCSKPGGKRMNNSAHMGSRGQVYYYGEHGELVDGIQSRLPLTLYIAYEINMLSKK